MPNPTSLNGTIWKCVALDMPEFGMQATVVDGKIDPESNGGQDIEIQYQNGQTAFMELRNFQSRFQQIRQPEPENVLRFTPKNHNRNGVYR